MVGSLSLHGGVFVALLLRPEPPPRLHLVVSGDGEGVVRAEPGELGCGDECAARYEPGTAVRLTAAAGEGSTFEGWPDSCEIGEGPLSCELIVTEDTRVEVRFGLPPDDVEVAWLAEDELPEQAFPALEMQLPDVQQARPAPEISKEAPEEEIDTLPDQVPDDKPEESRAQPERSNLKAVEVPDENIVDEAPEDAAFVSDKHRHVEEQTRAEDTNLDRQQDGEEAHSEPSELELDEVGTPDDVIAHLETSEPTLGEPEQMPESSQSGEDEQAAGQVPAEAGEESEKSEDGEDGDAPNEREPGLLSMRDLERQNMPGGELTAPEPGDQDDARPGAPDRRRLETRLSGEDYERIVGEDRVREEQELGRRQMSQRRGRWERRQQALRASLENFTPEVRPGNQTALSTRAEPFAVYIARMHRSIHELWGFGFLDELSRKPARHELNDWSLRTRLEIVIDSDGSVARTTIVQPSGVLGFDVAAIDAVQTGGPYGPPPSAIRSGNGKVYVHWDFHRDWRQCGTFGAHPFILDNPPEGGERGLDDGDLLERMPGRASASESSPPPSPRAREPRRPGPDSDDPRAQRAARRWVEAFGRRDAGAMATVSATPFRSGGRVVAKTRADVARIYESVLAEAEALAPLESTILTAAGYRRQRGGLPGGVDAASSRLFVLVRIPGEQLTLVLGQQGDGDYAVIGLER